MTHLYFDNSLSLKEKGLLSMLQIAIGNGDSPTMQDLIRLNADGSTAVANAMNGLIEKGYVERLTVRENGKIAGVRYKLKGK